MGDIKSEKESWMGGMMSEEQKVRFLLLAYNPRKCPMCGAIFGLHKHTSGYLKGKTICMNCGYEIGMTDSEYEKYRKERRAMLEKAGFAVKKVI